MMKFYLQLAILTLCIASNRINAQVQCRAGIPLSNYIPQNNSGNNRSGETFIIPVIVHIYNVSNFIQVTPGNVHECIDLTNKYYSGILPAVGDVQPEFQSLVSHPNVQLKLATKLPDSSCFNGIIFHDIPSFDLIPSDFSIYSIDTEHYLNIHIANGEFSYATFPTPGLNAGNPNDFIFLTTYDARLRQITLVHELGHWLGLSHTFGPSNTSGVSCNDDGIADTPPTKGSVGGTCNLSMSDCTPGVIENVNNHMDYSNCPMMFTAGQAERILNVIADTNLSRYQVGTLENIQRTGVLEQPYCEGTLTSFNDMFKGCDSTLIRLYGMYTGYIADSVSWYCPGATQELWLTDHPYVYYTTEGYKTAYFSVCRDGICTTLERTFFVDTVDASPTLPFTSFPFSEDFENNFSFPQTNMALFSGDLTPWQICNFTGYNSDHCLYVPAMYNTEMDTTTVRIGAFDFTQLNTVLVTAKVAFSAPENGSFCIFEIVLRESCNYLVASGAYLSLQPQQMNEGNTEPNFVPSNSTQWHDIQFTWPNWTNAANAELDLRVRYFPLTPGNTPEAFYLDDITVGEMGVITGVEKSPISDFRFYPNPAQDNIFLQFNATQQHTVKVLNAIGEIVLDKSMHSDGVIDISFLSPGVYFIHVGNSVQKLLKF
jgi:hypothetical protein